MSEQGVFMYGFLDTAEPVRLGPSGIEEADVYNEPRGEISALVSRTPFTGFESLSREALLRNLARYQAVIERVMEDHQVLPVKYGTFLKGEEELKTVLATGRTEVLNHFERMRQKLELDVVALWSNMRDVLAEIGETEEVRSLKERAAMVSPEGSTDIRVAVGKAVKVGLDARSRKRASEILDVLKKWAEDSAIHPLMDDSMMMNAAFLLKRANREAFEQAVAQLDRRYEDKVLFRIVGPLPPYSFCTLEIQKPDIRQLLEAREALGLGEEATALEIRESYWRLTKEFHPDRFPGDSGAQERFEGISSAYRTLCEFCRNDRISFKEDHVGEWMQIRPMKQYARAG